eukprot:409740_1
MAQKCLNFIANTLREGTTSKVVVVAGAGISTPSGLPDFRTAGSGLYDSVKDRFDLSDPTDVFDINYFHRNPKPFFQIARSLYPGCYVPNVAHWFVRLLQQENKLLRMYTQNIDGLEQLAGIERRRLVEAHGSFASATCLGCNKRYNAADIKPAIFRGQVP